MSLPINTTVEDIESVCAYLATKPMGASLDEARAVLDAKFLYGRKLSAMKEWGLIDEDEGTFRATDLGRAAAKGGGASLSDALANVIRNVLPYFSIIERAAHRKEATLTSADVGAHWHEHFRDQISSSEETLNRQTVCFFRIADGAGLGKVIIGRRGAPTRFDFSAEALEKFVGRIQAQPAVQPAIAHADEAVGGITPPDEWSEPSEREEQGEGIFIAHGKNKKPLEQLKEVLDQFKIPYKVAVEEPNLGRPIGSKVREIMQSCNCAILIFTADEEFKDNDGDPVWRPSENVVYELGAAGYLYGNRIVIMKEEDVKFPANFQDIGYISFTKDQLGNKAMDIMKELVGFGIVKFTT